MTHQELKQVLDQEGGRFLDEWKRVLAFPSVSADPAHDADCRGCAEWLADHLRGIGFAAEVLPTASKPVAFGEWRGRPDKPVVLFYGHYDVQPVDPVEEWRTPPFVPTLVHGRLYARGAEDNKGQFMYALKAMETLIRRGRLDCSVKVLIEGEEECGSGGLAGRLEQWRDRLGADVLLVTDTGTVSSGAPTLTMGLRGIVMLTATLSGPHRDLHSGMHGGLAPNPAMEMARLMASLHRRDGRIAVKGFAAGIKPPSPIERRLVNADPFDEAAYAADTGVPPVGGEKAFSPSERLGFRPSIDINGLHSGYGGAGSKTIIPSRAVAKITARLAAGQDPQRSLAAIVRHLRERAPEGLSLRIDETAAAGRGFRLDPDAPLVAKAMLVLDGLTGQAAVYRWEGASIPIVSSLAAVSGSEPLLAGFGREEDSPHAPNESFSLDQFRLGYLYVASILTALAD